MIRICMIGTGYVGLVSGACMADFGHHVTCVDINQERIQGLIQGEIPFYEPNLDRLVLKNVEEGLFLLNSNGEIGAQYSQSLEVVLGEKDLSQKNLIKLLENKIPSKMLSSSAEYIELMFNDDIDEKTINELNPLAEIELNVNNKLGIWKGSKYLLFKLY